MPMVQYWKSKSTVQAKIIKKDGVWTMKLDGEKQTFPTFPRGYLLFGKLSKLKHEIKNQIFNDSWWRLEEGIPNEQVIREAKEKLFTNISELMKEFKYDLIPPEGLCQSVREIHRAFTRIGENHLQKEKIYLVRDMLCLILHEDDGYRFRAMDMAEYFNPNRWYIRLYGFLTGKSYFEMIKTLLEKALQTIEHCEVIGDMKERIRLFRRIILLAISDPKVGRLFEKLCQELNWKKLFLTEADRFHFRGKYYKVDYRIFDY